MENGPCECMYFLLNMWIFQPAMFVYQRVIILKGNDLEGKTWLGGSRSTPLRMKSLTPKAASRAMLRLAQIARDAPEPIREEVESVWKMVDVWPKKVKELNLMNHRFCAPFWWSSSYQSVTKISKTYKWKDIGSWLLVCWLWYSWLDLIRPQQKHLESWPVQLRFPINSDDFAAEEALSHWSTW